MARIVFDLDGTLVHSTPTLAAAGNALLGGLGRAPIDIVTVTGFVGHGVRVLVQRLLGATGGVPGDDVTPHLARFREIYAADPLTGTEPFDGVPEALSTLAAAGHGLAVCTQKPNEPALRILRGRALMPPITGFTGGDSLPGVLKPDPRMVAHAAGQLPEAPLVYVGDSETDAATAEAAGVPFLLFTEGYRLTPLAELPHAAAFSDFAALPGLVAEVLGAAEPA
jgi:phosphoglycolate phosphatase